MRTYKIVVIKGDGIGPELVDASMVVLAAVEQSLGGFKLEVEYREGGAGCYRNTGENLSAETMQAIKNAHATMKGPVGLPEVRLKDGTEAGTLGGVLRTGLDTYVNLRPVRLMPGVDAPTRAQPGTIDYAIVRENTEGLYLSRGKGIGTNDAMADTLLITRKGTERVARYAFELARRRNGSPVDGIKRVTCVDKSNVLASYAFFRRIFDEVGEAYPDVKREYLYADAAAQELVLNPSHFDVLVMENLLGDILSDLGGATVGGIGLCPSGNIGDKYAYFEPIHGSAPGIAGQDKANPVSQVLTAALMLEHLGEAAAAGLVRRAQDGRDAGDESPDTLPRLDPVTTGDPISLKRRTTSEVDPYRMELSHGAMRVQYDLDLNAPSQRFIYDCCQGGGVYEAATAFLMTQVLRPGDTFVDVGAHVGFFTMIAGAIVGPAGRVIAFEPNAENFAALQNNATLNGFAHVTCINAAVGDRDGEAAFFENLDNDGGHALWDPGLHPFNEQSRDRQAMRRLPIARLDTVLPSLGVGSVKAVKIDTEGAEVQVLDGGRQCLAAPGLALLVCEDNEFGLERMGTSGVELRRILDKLGFAVCVLDGKGGLQQIAVDAPHQSASVDNFYCVRPPKP